MQYPKRLLKGVGRRGLSFSLIFLRTVFETEQEKQEKWQRGVPQNSKLSHTRNKLCVEKRKGFQQDDGRLLTERKSEVMTVKLTQVPVLSPPVRLALQFVTTTEVHQCPPMSPYPRASQAPYVPCWNPAKLSSTGENGGSQNCADTG